MTRSTWSVVMTALAVLLSAAATLATAPAATSADPLAGAPAVGECRDYTIKAMSTPNEDSTAVDCTGPHTGLVVKVAIAPSKYDLSGRPSLQLGTYVTKTCASAWRKAIGATHAQEHLVVYTHSWYLPTAEQLALGARWIRCDVNGFDSGRLGDIPTATPFVNGNIDDADRRCLNKKGQVLPCTERHAWTSRGIFTMPKGGYSVARQDAAAKQKCPGTLKRGDTRILWWRVSESAWKSGERHVTCYGNGNG